MLNKLYQNKMILIAILFGTILTFDFFTIITNLYVAPVLEGYGLPDILIYIKTIIFLTVFIILIVWLKQQNPKFPKNNLKTLVILSLAIVAFYFGSLYMYKYMLISDTADIIKNRILNGNPALYLDFSGINYRTLTYILTIFSGFNSELVLFAEMIVLLVAYYSIKYMEEIKEEKHVYDEFMFDTTLLPLVFVWTIMSFLSINILTYRYDMLGSLEIGFAVMGFSIVATTIVPAFSISRNKNNECTRSFFIGMYKHVFFIGILSIIIYVVLIGINISLLNLGRHTYRLYTSLFSLIFSIIIMIRVKKILSLENK
ncbi:MAG: hypothetical protein RBR75_06785 [Acholeplasmataceae bacterium]|jgi:hypothetical protein|nr:hypothetical protein [Acholeplasmataceae bacterium]